MSPWPVSSDKCWCYLLSWQKWPSATRFWVRVGSPPSSAAIWETISLETSFIGVIFLFPCGNSSAFAGQKRGAVKAETSCSASSSSAQFLPSSSAAVHELKSVVGLCWHSCGQQQGLSRSIADGSLTVFALIMHLELGHHLSDQSTNK